VKKIVIFSVVLKNLSNFSFFPGAAEFREKYGKYEYEYSYFSFDIEKDNWFEIEKELQLLKLDYEKYFEIKLEDNEIVSYPVFNLTIPSLYDLIIRENEDIVNFSEMSNTPIAQDFKSGLLVTESGIIEVLADLNSEIKPKDEKFFTHKKKKYQILCNLPALESPRIILSGKAVKKNLDDCHSSFYVDGWDGRSSLLESDISFINNKHFVASWLFAFRSVQYRQNVPNYLVSGSFANYLSKIFKQSVQLTPITLDKI